MYLATLIKAQAYARSPKGTHDSRSLLEDSQREKPQDPLEHDKQVYAYMVILHLYTDLCCTCAYNKYCKDGRLLPGRWQGLNSVGGTGSGFAEVRATRLPQQARWPCRAIKVLDLESSASKDPKP